jgi:hypothetical protein
MSWFVGLGLSLLYVSAYYLPLLSPLPSYFVPSVRTFVVFPAAVAGGALKPLWVFGARWLV